MRRILLLFFFVYGFCVSAQVRSRIFIDGKEFRQVQLEDSVALFSYLNSLQTAWLKKGHYFSGIDSLTSSKEELHIYLHKGDQSDIEFEGIKKRNLIRHLETELKAYSNNGYPFASLQIDSVRMHDQTIKGNILVRPGPEIRYDSAFFFEKPKTNQSYIFQLLDIVPGSLFSERDYASISLKIERSAFLQLNRPTDLSFKDNKAEVFLDISESTSNTFQGVLGLLQQQDGRTTAVGSLELDIQNLFKSGKQFRFFWERFSEESQKLDLVYKHPFFLDSKLTPSFRFGLLRQDTTFLNRVLGLGLNTFITPRIELFFEFERSNGTLLSTELETISNERLADFTRNIYTVQFLRGLESSLSSLKEGMVWDLSLSAGAKTIDQNLSIPTDYYDTIQLKSDFYRFEGDLHYQLRLFKRQTFYHHIQGASLKNNELLTNELYRLGGLNTIRGFNEKSLFADNFVLSRLEFRSFFEQKSYVYMFYDQLFIGRNSFVDSPFGLGLGFVLATSAGQFSFALAVGDAEDQPLSFSTVKAHFGYISRF